MGRVKVFNRIVGSGPYDYQVRVWEKIDSMAQEKEPKILKIIAPTAGGKTEAALFSLLCPYSQGEYPFSSVIYVLPNKSLVNVQRQRIVRLFSSLLEESGWDKKKAEEFAQEQVLVDYGHIMEKPMYSGLVNITTWDSFAYSLGARRTVSRRFTMPASITSTSLVVFDEVQMLQDEFAYLPRLLGTVIHHVNRKLGVPMIVMSATIPSKFEELMFEKVKEGVLEESPRKSDHRKPERGKIKVRLEKWDPKTLKKPKKATAFFKEVTEEAGEGKVLFVFNTVSRAVEAYQSIKSLFGDDSVLLVHGKFTHEDRQKKEEELNTAKMIIATQVVEAGLDLPDVSLVVTENCPADALIQRIGRCARRPGTEGMATILNHSKNVPYPKNLVKKLSQDDTLKIEKALRDNRKAQEFIDEKYKDYDPKKTGKGGPAWSYARSATEYLHGLMLLSSPPTAVPYKARLGYYVTLVPLEKEAEKEQEYSISPERVLEKSLPYSVGSLYVYGKRIDSLKNIISFQLVPEKQEDTGRTVYVKKDFRGYVVEGGVYAIKSETYDPEIGLEGD